MLEVTVDWLLIPWSTHCSIKANLGETLSSETSTNILRKIPPTMMQINNSARLLRIHVSDQSQLIGIKTQRLYPTVICWLACRQDQTINYVTAETQDPFPKKINPERLKHLKSLDDEQTKVFLSPSVAIVF